MGKWIPPGGGGLGLGKDGLQLILLFTTVFALTWPDPLPRKLRRTWASPCRLWGRRAHLTSPRRGWRPARLLHWPPPSRLAQQKSCKRTPPRTPCAPPLPNLSPARGVPRWSASNQSAKTQLTGGRTWPHPRRVRRIDR
ncbi:uncharacterized protein BDZ99DRAFT_96168 [Mytilinidion resinicola]|uniref:Uncharacterized protein n=1 Tax=Mytilinidion resinicola TaxID=574789 RepID=A0A6A6YD97_9PEZI|nr:uncharacterized protein BDZ99DRAFT_96168 [Mytilinidion resinicola]KAF2806503.1 hypothetical protein BDZ99DRAFT_96168 [Mytilinidion resinicola]